MCFYPHFLHSSGLCGHVNRHTSKGDNTVEVVVGAADSLRVASRTAAETDGSDRVALQPSLPGESLQACDATNAKHASDSIADSGRVSSLHAVAALDGSGAAGAGASGDGNSDGDEGEKSDDGSEHCVKSG